MHYRRSLQVGNCFVEISLRTQLVSARDCTMLFGVPTPETPSIVRRRVFFVFALILLLNRLSLNHADAAALQRYVQAAMRFSLPPGLIAVVVRVGGQSFTLDQ